MEEVVENQVANDQIEKDSYSNYSYKYVSKTRQKAKLRGQEIPYLSYPVKKQEKPRPLFLTLGIICSVFLALVCAGIAYLAVVFAMPMILNLIGITKDLTFRHELDIFAIGPLFGSMISFFLWTIIIIFVLAAVAILMLLIALVRKLFGLSRASMQEVAHGHLVGGLITSMIMCIVIPVVIAIFMFVTFKEMKTAGVILIIVTLLIVFAVFGSILALLLVERNKARKEFETLPKEEQDDFMVHAKALEVVAKKRARGSNLSRFSDLEF